MTSPAYEPDPATREAIHAILWEAVWKEAGPDRIDADTATWLNAGLKQGIAALATTGRLLPALVETTTEWGVWWHGDNPDGIVLTEYRIGWRDHAERRAKERIGEYGITSFTVVCCEHRKFADRSVWIGGWVKAPAEVPA
jgi:ribosome modulation factor